MTRRGQHAVALAFMIAGVAWLWGRDARADVVTEILPTVSVGVTDNAGAVPPLNRPRADEFGTVSGTGRVHSRGPHADNSLGYRLSASRYLHDRGPSSLSQELAGLSDLGVTAALQLRLGLAVTYGQTASPSGVDVNAAAPTAQPASSSRFLSAVASEEAVYTLSARARILQNLRFSGVHFFGPRTTIESFASSYVIGALVRGEREVGRSLLDAQLDVSETGVPSRGEGLPDQVLFVQALAGCRRDLSLAWFVELQAGALGAFEQGTSAFEPAGTATVSYRHVDWFATLTASQSGAPNLFIGAATISDQALARLALPLTRSDRYFVVGYGGYTYARLVDGTGEHRAYELRTAGASLTARSERYPIFASLDYTFSSQLGNVNDVVGPSSVPGGPARLGTIQDLERQTIMLTIGGAFVSGHGAPPVFHGVLPAIQPVEERGAARSEEKPAEEKPSGNVKDVPR